MTGIAAIFATGPVNQGQLTRMLGAMEARARDGIDSWVNGSFGLGAAMLHTTAESLEAPQPYRNEDASLVLVMDGYLTNWEELRRDLAGRGAVLRNASDAELVLRAYEQWGENCAERIEGEFAFVIADQRARRVYAARDHQGLKPLFYWRAKDALLIASDMQAILAALDQLPEPDLDYLTGIAAVRFMLPENTVWKGLLRLQPSHWLTSDGERLKTQRYFELPLGERIRYKTDAEYAEHYRAVLFDAVRRTSRTHRPLAMAVSGGLDSSALFCIAHRLEQQGNLLAPSIQGYTLAAQPGSAAYELDFARAAANHVGRPLVEVPLFKPPLAWYTDRARRERDLPTSTNGAMLMDIEQRVHGDGSRVYINGDGGDEWLQGNTQYYHEFAQEGDWAGFWHALRRDGAAKGYGVIVPHAIRTVISGLAPDKLRLLKKARQRREMFRDDGEYFWLTAASRAILEQQDAAYDGTLPTSLGAWLKVNLFQSQPSAYGRAVAERQAGCNGIEYRQPMLTRQFIAFSVATPEHIRRRASTTKIIHRIAMQGILPDMILKRRTKANFESNATDLEMADYCAGEGGKVLDGIYDKAGLDHLVNAVRSQSLDEDRSWEIWTAYAVAAFLAHARIRPSGAD